MSLVLLRGFSSVLERHVLAWRMADSFEVGGLEEGKELLIGTLIHGEEFLWL